MEKKIDILVRLMRENSWVEAIKLAAKFPRLGEHRNAILSASSALLSPNFYISMGKNPEDIFNTGVIALREKYAQHI